MIRYGRYVLRLKISPRGLVEMKEGGLGKITTVKARRKKQLKHLSKKSVLLYIFLTKPDQKISSIKEVKNARFFR